MYEAIREACERLVTKFDDFWLLAAITDWSYEEGIRDGANKGFARAVLSLERAGVPVQVVGQLRDGINGNLAALIREYGLNVKRNVSPGPDLEVRNITTGQFSLVEVKMLYDCTLPKYYPEIADDRQKQLQRIGPNTDCFQAVFFTQLPCFRYPRGCWYGSVKPDKARQTHWAGIHNQFRQLTTVLPHPPTWPSERPFTHNLPFPTQIVSEELLLRRYGTIFVPDYPWTFSAFEQLKDAQVGVALWHVK